MDPGVAVEGGATSGQQQQLSNVQRVPSTEEPQASSLDVSELHGEEDEPRLRLPPESVASRADRGERKPPGGRREDAQSQHREDSADRRRRRQRQRRERRQLLPQHSPTAARAHQANGSDTALDSLTSTHPHTHTKTNTAQL